MLFNFLKREKEEPETLSEAAIYNGIYGLAIGDALGLPVEFKSREWLTEHPIKTMIGYGAYNKPPGTWSDDTGLTLALLDALAKGNYSLEQITTNSINWLKEGKYAIEGHVFDVGLTTSQSLNNLNNGISLSEVAKQDERSNGNGSLMRILPLAFWLKNEHNPKKRMKIIHETSELTHPHIYSKTACHLYVELAIQLLNNQDPQEAYHNTKELILKLYKSNTYQKTRHEFHRILEGDIEQLEKSHIDSSGYVIDTLESALWCLLTTNSYEECLTTAINLGGDTDTIGAVVGGLAGIFYGKDTIPSEWLRELKGKDILDDTINKYIQGNLH